MEKYGNKYGILYKAAICLVILFFIVSCNKQGSSSEHDLLHLKSSKTDRSKPVIVVMVDSLLSSGIDQAIKENQLPAIQYLIEHGQYYKEFISSFPTMSVTIEGTLFTGTYADKHRIPGLVWYSQDENKYINYGTGLKDVMKRGPNPFLTQAFMDLNGKHLSARTPTIYEELADRGYQSGSVNGIIYRGKQEHKLHFPAWLHGATSLPEDITVKGPDFFTFGAFSNPLEGKVDLDDNVMQKMGMNDQFAADVVSYLIAHEQVPDLLFVYLADLDHQLHEEGPSNIDMLSEIDEKISQMMQSYGGYDEALKKAIFIVMGDSGVSQIKPENEHPVIQLPELLSHYQVHEPGEDVTEQTEIVLGVNATMAYVYNKSSDFNLQQLAQDLKIDDRIDLIAWQDNDWVYVEKGGTSKTMRYRPEGPEQDPYKQTWTVQHDVDVLDIMWDKEKHTLQYGEYPDVLQRLYAALNSHEGDFLVITSKMGYEFADEGATTHVDGGSHGSLHKFDSIAPVIIGGTKQKPPSQRMVDFKAYLLDLITEGQ